MTFIFVALGMADRIYNYARHALQKAYKNYNTY